MALCIIMFMQITITERDENNIVTLTLETEPGHAKEAYSKTLRRLGENLNIKGFRKGKAPTKVVEEHYGAAAVRAQTLDNSFLSKLLDDAFKKQDLSVVNISTVEKVEFDSPDSKIIVQAQVELFPEVTLPDYKKLKLTVEIPKVDEKKQFAETLERVRNNNSQYEESSEAISMGDEIVFDFDGSYKAEDGTWTPKPGMKAEGFQTVVETGRFINNFLEQLVGMKAGESKEIEVEFPADYHDPDLNGKAAKFAIKIQKVSKANLPEVNDEFAKKLGHDNVAALEKKIQDEIAKYNENIKRNAAVQAILTELRAKAKMQVSTAMVERELNHDLQTLKQRNGWDDKKFAEFKDTINMESELAQAREKLERSVIMTTIIKQEKLEATQEDLQEAFAKLNIPPDFDTSKIDMSALVNQLNLDILTNKAMDLLIEAAKIQYKEVEGLVEEEHEHVHGPGCNH